MSTKVSSFLNDEADIKFETLGWFSKKILDCEKEWKNLKQRFQKITHLFLQKQFQKLSEP